MSTNPANSITDSVRAGLVILFKEEEMGRQLVNSLTSEQLTKGYNSRKKTDIVYSEKNKKDIVVPDEGIYFNELNKQQQQFYNNW